MKEAKLVSKQNAEHRSIINIGPGVNCGEKELVIIGGPCSVENMEQMQITTKKLEQAPVQAIRGGVYKPRTSPYAFQGMGEEGLKILAAIREEHHVPVVTEVMSQEQLPLCAKYADVLQVGSRNMQNFELLKALGSAGKPWLLSTSWLAAIQT
jgi:3-deoxy-7-phosphoheptulonate synthase